MAAGNPVYGPSAEPGDVPEVRQISITLGRYCLGIGVRSEYNRWW
jgi:hypothetical protein